MLLYSSKLSSLQLGITLPFPVESVPKKGQQTVYRLLTSRPLDGGRSGSSRFHASGRGRATLVHHARENDKGVHVEDIQNPVAKTAEQCHSELHLQSSFVSSFVRNRSDTISEVTDDDGQTSVSTHTRFCSSNQQQIVSVLEFHLSLSICLQKEILQQGSCFLYKCKWSVTRAHCNCSLVLSCPHNLCRHIRRNMSANTITQDLVVHWATTQASLTASWPWSFASKKEPDLLQQRMVVATSWMRPFPSWHHTKQQRWEVDFVTLFVTVEIVLVLALQGQRQRFDTTLFASAHGAQGSQLWNPFTEIVEKGEEWSFYWPRSSE